MGTSNVKMAPTAVCAINWIWSPEIVIRGLLGAPGPRFPFPAPHLSA